MKSLDSYIYNPKTEIEKERLRERDKRTSTRRSFALNNFKFNNIQRILDVGCGDGVVGFDLLSHSTNASLVGIDIEPTILEDAQNRSPDGFLCDFVASDGFKLPFVNSTFNMVTCQYVLQHVSKPILILEEMRRVSCRHAKVVIFEWDDGVNFSYPPMPAELNKLFQAKIHLIHDRGGDRYIGRKLYHHLHSAGWKDIEIKIIHDIWQGPADRENALRGTELSLVEIKSQLIKNNLITENEFDIGINQLVEYYSSDIFSVAFFFAGVGVNLG